MSTGKLNPWIGLGAGFVVVLGLGIGVAVYLPGDRWSIFPRNTSQHLSPGQSLTNSIAVEKSAKEKGSALVNLGNELFREGKLEEALKAYEEAQVHMPDDEDVFYNLGIVLTRLGRESEAVRSYQRALELLPDYAEAHNNLGNLLLRQGNINDALVHFNAAIAALPDYAVAHNNLGTALRELGMIPQATQAFLKASQLDTNYWQARFNLAGLYMVQELWHEAAAEYREVLRLEPEFIPARKRLSEALAKAGEKSN